MTFESCKPLSNEHLKSSYNTRQEVQLSNIKYMAVYIGSRKQLQIYIDVLLAKRTRQLAGTSSATNLTLAFKRLRHRRRVAN